MRTALQERPVHNRHAAPTVLCIDDDPDVSGAIERRLSRYEARIAEWSRLCVVTTAAEESLLRSFAPWARTAVVPNGVDLEEYVPATHPCLDPTLIFTGAMDYFPNVDAVEHFCQ